MDSCNFSFVYFLTFFKLIKPLSFPIKESLKCPAAAIPAFSDNKFNRSFGLGNILTVQENNNVGILFKFWGQATIRRY